MKKLLQNKIFVIGAILALIITFVIVMIILIGKAYKGSLQNIDSNQQNQVDISKMNKIRKITLKKQDKSCIEVMPDGVVRIYSKCDEKLSDAGRLVNQTSILKLFNLANKSDLSQYRNKKNDSDYLLILDTINGTEVYYIPTGPPGNQNPGSDIIEIIEIIKEEIKHQSPVSSVYNPPVASNYISPSPSNMIYYSPYPYPSETTLIKPFVCDFQETGGKKKVNVSNIICSSDPSPAP